MNGKMLKLYIVRYDGMQKKLAEAMGLSLSRLNAKINGTRGADFSQTEISFIKTRYRLSNRDVCEIFLQTLYRKKIYAQFPNRQEGEGEMKYYLEGAAAVIIFILLIRIISKI